MACTRKLCDEAARRPATCVAATEEPDWNDINDDEGYFGPDKCVYGDRECSDCNCASCNLCVDNYGTRGSFYTTSASQMTMNQPCWTYLRDEGYTTQNNPAGTRDAYMWRTNGESGPENKTCKWVGKDAVNRCAMKGVMIEGAIGSSTPYYMPGEQIGLAWLFANQPAYLASDACPLACCVDDPYWTYARDDGVHDCAHVAELPSKRCDREDFDTGTFARDKCPAACGACISTDDICQDDIFWHHTYRSYQHCGWVKESPRGGATSRARTASRPRGRARSRAAAATSASTTRPTSINRGKIANTSPSYRRSAARGTTAEACCATCKDFKVEMYATGDVVNGAGTYVPWSIVLVTVALTVVAAVTFNRKASGVDEKESLLHRPSISGLGA